METLSQKLAFFNEIDKLKAVYRQARVRSDNNRRENSAEHSWQLGLMAFLFAADFTDEVDLLKVCHMLLIHDLVEIDAGDTFAFADAATLAAQGGKEDQAANRLFGLLPEGQAEEFLTLWQEFEANTTPEARTAKALDKVAPFLQNIANEGGSWKHHKVKKSQVLARNKGLEKTIPALWEYVLVKLDDSVARGWLEDA